MICKDCYFKLIRKAELDILVYGEASYSDEDLECDCDEPSLVIELIEEKIRDNIERTNTWNGIEVE